MESFGIHELQQRPDEIVAELERHGEPVLVTRDGKPAAVLLPIDMDAFEDWVLGQAPEFVADLRAANDDLQAGRTRPALEVLAELEVEQPGKRS